MDTKQIMTNTKNMIDDLKSVCGSNGLGNAPSEYKIITVVFLYKFLNDKFLYDIRQIDKKWMDSKNIEADLDKLSEEEYEDLIDELPASTAILKRQHFVSYLFNRKNQKKTAETKAFNELFDETLVEISNLNKDIFSVHAGGEDMIKLFDPISQYVIESNKREAFCRAIIDKLVEFSFEEVFSQKYDFFASIFEYLIKDYNKDFGKYAEYYTPHSIASIIAEIIVPDGTKNVTVYDPAAGSGTLVLALAHEIGEENCTIYTQDITQKSNEFLRLNLILNNLVHSLGNVVHGDTLLSPQHYDKQKKELMKFDYIVSNPPFNVDFSDTRDTLAGEKYKERFWAGVPNVPSKDKKSMQIYLMFVQHIIKSMKPNGKAAIVIPTPFLTKGKGIDPKIRKYVVDKHMLRGVITMPKNIFSTTGTQVSVIFLENNDSDEEVLFIEAANLGSKSDESERNQKIVLSSEEKQLIINTYKERKVQNGFSVKADWNLIKKKEYRLSPSSYFEHKLEYEEYSKKQLSQNMISLVDSMRLYYSKELETILQNIFNYWFVQFEFPCKKNGYKSEGGEFEYNSYLETEIPKGWRVESILDVCNVIDCLHSKKPDEVFESEEYYLLQLENILSDGRIDISKKYYISEADYRVWSSRIEIREGDFVVTNAGRAGAIGMVSDGIKCAIGRNMTAIRSVEVSPYYMRQFLYSPYMDRFLISNLDEGSFFKSFNVKSIKKIYVLVPPENIMEEYLKVTKPLIDIILDGIRPEGEIGKIKKILSTFI